MVIADRCLWIGYRDVDMADDARRDVGYLVSTLDNLAAVFNRFCAGNLHVVARTKPSNDYC